MTGATAPRHLLTRRLHPAWVVAGAGFLALLLAAGFRATPGVLIVPLQHEFGWSRATISGAVSVNLVLFGLAGAFVAFYGLDWIATVPPTVALVTQTFGRETGTIVWGWVFASHQIGAAVAATCAGAIRDAAGTYNPAFLVAGALCLLAAGLCPLARGWPERTEPLPVPNTA